MTHSLSRRLPLVVDDVFDTDVHHDPVTDTWVRDEPVDEAAERTADALIHAARWADHDPHTEAAKIVNGLWKTPDAHSRAILAAIEARRATWVGFSPAVLAARALSDRELAAARRKVWDGDEMSRRREHRSAR